MEKLKKEGKLDKFYIEKYLKVLGKVYMDIGR